MKYRYLILPDNGDVWGTNNLKAAVKAAEIDLVIDVSTAERIDEDGDRDGIEEYEPPEDPEEGEDE